jgi:APA family basic amino acid/polyamine antiporter
MSSLPENVEAGREGPALRRMLGPLQLIAVGIGAIIGAGIFVVTGHAAASYAGPGVVISFGFAGLSCLLAALCYAEYASMIPVAGSAYTYTYATLGRLPGWMIGWNLVLEYLVSAAAVATGWSGYLTDLLGRLGVPISARLAATPFALHGLTGFTATGAFFNLPAAVLVLVMTSLLVVGIQASVRINSVMVVIKLAIVMLVIGVGFAYIAPVNHTPFIPTNAGQFGHFGWSGVFRATGVIFFAYLGFDAVSVLAQEARNPQRDVPIGILTAVVVCTALYMLMSYVVTGLTPYTSLNVANPVSMAIEQAVPGMRWLACVINAGAVVGLASVVLVLLLAQSRIFYAMSSDGVIPALFGRIHPRFRTPYLGTIVNGVIAALLAGVVPLDILGELISIGTLAAFAFVCLGVLVLRLKAPLAHRPFRTPFVWLVAPLGGAFCGVMMASLPLDTWVRLLVWSLIGLAIYCFYGVRHSRPSRWSIAVPQAAAPAKVGGPGSDEPTVLKLRSQ